MVIIHPGIIERLGIHHSWSTSIFVDVRGVAANCEEADPILVDPTIRVGLLGLAAVDPLQNVSEASNVAIVQRVLRSYASIKWIILATQSSGLCSTAADGAGAIGYFDTPLTSEQLESAVAWADAESPDPAWQLDPGQRVSQSPATEELATRAALPADELSSS